MQGVTTIHRHIVEEQRDHPEASGDLSRLLNTVALATKIISRHVNKAGLLNVLGKTGDINVQGEKVAKLDDFSNEVVKDSFRYSGVVAGLASEEEDTWVDLGAEGADAKYVVLFDPLDGSSNIDANVSIGTIFSIYRRRSEGGSLTDADFLQPGRELVAAGYAVYGSSTMLVYTTGHKVHGFTLDPEYGEFLLSHEDIRIPDACAVYSANERNAPFWQPGVSEFVNELKTSDDPRYREVTARYIGSLVADFHRNLLYGGVFVYPEDSRSPAGKLRLMYEAIPLAFVAEAAGGAASTGFERITTMQPTAIHQRVPLCVGNTREVARYEALRKELG
ncbi:MAG: fructose-1,6-bisphosphatase I [Myxococcota bacterium]|jgi:fructose-1,6-bisphosphatase I